MVDHTRYCPVFHAEWTTVLEQPRRRNRLLRVKETRRKAGSGSRCSSGCVFFSWLMTQNVFKQCSRDPDNQLWLSGLRMTFSPKCRIMRETVISVQNAAGHELLCSHPKIQSGGCRWWIQYRHSTFLFLSALGQKTTMVFRPNTELVISYCMLVSVKKFSEASKGGIMWWNLTLHLLYSYPCVAAVILWTYEKNVFQYQSLLGQDDA